MYREGIYRRDENTLTWASVATNTANIAPGTDTVIDCRNAKSIILQVDQLATTYAGADTDINIITRSAGTTTYDTVPYATVNLGSASVVSLAITPGMAYFKLRADNNSTAAKCKPQVIVQVMG